jgi:hypothetical protein
MAKKEKNTITDEGTARAEMPSDIGQGDFSNLPAQVTDFNAFENIPCFVPGKNLEEGMTLKGRFRLTKRVFSEKFTAGKKDEAGRKYRDLHILTDAKERAFGIWSVGKLNAAMSHLVLGDYIEVTYEGKDLESLRPGQSPAHHFSFRGVGVNGQPLVADWNRETLEDEAPESPGYRTERDALGEGKVSA